MSGERQWTIAGSPHRHEMEVIGGPVLDHCSPIAVVEASRLAAVEAERDALREGLEFYADRNNYRDHVPEVRHAGYEAYPLSDDGKTARDVLARFPKNNETAEAETKETT